MGLKWYIVNVVSGQERKISDEINRIASKDKDIEKAFVPVRKTIKVKKGKKVEDLQKLFPGYVFVNVSLGGDAYDKINSVPKVIGFLGPKAKPEVISDEKVESILKKMETQETEEEEVTFDIGDTVKVIAGPFESFTGTVERYEKKMLKISISIFGRPTIVDIDVSRVEKV